MIIAIDGPAASGKGTLAKRIAAHLGYHHLDTGLLYRAVAQSLMERGLELTDRSAALEAASAPDLMRYSEALLKRAEMGEAASVVAAYAEVRQAILETQRAFGRRLPGAVLDGRDIGTIVLPGADVKLFVTASPEERALRRARELREAGHIVDDAQVLEDIRRRDERDQTRAVSPLRPAADAALLDTTELDIEAAFRAAVEIVERRAKAFAAEPRA